MGQFVQGWDRPRGLCGRSPGLEPLAPKKKRSGLAEASPDRGLEDRAVLLLNDDAALLQQFARRRQQSREVALQRNLLLNHAILRRH
jgi:hypothetical protein